MSVLLIGTPRRGAPLIERLVRQGDQVRVIEDDPSLARAWSGLGAHVAKGRGADADLVERAASGVRTVVVVQRIGEHLHEVLEAVVAAARLAAQRPRVVVCAADLDAANAELVARSGLEHVILRTGATRRRLLPRSVERIDVDKIAEAIDAADDLGGDVRLDLDLTSAPGWRMLGLEPPRRVATRASGTPSP